MNKIEEVKKLKQLLDDGVITEQDFAEQKKRIFDLDDKAVEIETAVEKNDESGVEKSLETYEKELMKEANAAENKESSNNIRNDNNEFYERERLREKAKLDAQEEIREEKNKKRKEEVNKGINSTKRALKWILAVFCIIMGVGSFGTSFDSSLIYIPIGIIFMLLGLMACPKITDYTIKYEKYTKLKTVIVISLVILFVILCCI